MFTGTRALSRKDVTTLLTLEDCIPAVEAALRDHALGRTMPAGVLGIHADDGGFHIKASGLLGERPVFVTKVNGNFARNEERFGLPRIQGLLMLCDARCGYPLAVMDSTEITVLRTAAATGVAAAHLARRDAAVATLAGCGRQAAAQLSAVAAVRPLRHAFVFDMVPDKARALAVTLTTRLAIPVEPVTDLAAATRCSDVVVTCTSATRPILCAGDVRPGTFIAAVGADSETKQEIDPALMASAVVVPDILEQCAAIGDLHHALDAGLMTRDDVRGELGAVIAGLKPGRGSDQDIVVFDSTGTGLQDAAAARLVLERAERAGRGVVLDLMGEGNRPPQRGTAVLPFLAFGARL